MPKQRERIFGRRDLSVIARLFKFTAAIDDGERYLVRAPGRLSIQRRGSLFQLRIQRVEENQTLLSDQRGHHLGKRITKLPSGLISSAQELFQIIAEFSFWQRGQQTFNTLLDSLIQHDPANRQAVRVNFRRNRNAAEKAIAIDAFRSVSFSKVLILPAQPNSRHCMKS